MFCYNLLFRFADGVPRCCQAQLRNNAKSKHKQCRRSSSAAPPVAHLIRSPSHLTPKLYFRHRNYLATVGGTNCVSRSSFHSLLNSSSL